MKRADYKFVEVPRDAVPEAKDPAIRASALSLALESGKALFVEGRNAKEVNSLRAKDGYLRKRGFRIVTVNGEWQGKTGVFVSAEREETS